MIAAVPKAAVVITNPTHCAVALEYERGMDAPMCVAKGVDALKIREVADKHSVPIVENPPLARALHATVEIDQQIPPVIGHVMRLRRMVPARR
jgi:flagellar biosynthetic protein FlhB